MLGLLVQTWTPKMFAQHVHCTKAISGYDPRIVMVFDRKSLEQANSLSSLNCVAHAILMPNGVDAKVDAWANSRGWPEDPCATSVIFRLSCVSYAAICVNDLICLPLEWLWGPSSCWAAASVHCRSLLVYVHEELDHSRRDLQ